MTHLNSKSIFFLVNQLKPGGEIPAKGKKITLHVQNVKDLSRGVIKVRKLLFSCIIFLSHLAMQSFKLQCL